MGVPKFYRWISERYPCLSEIVREYQIPEYDNLYLDMNGIIHNCSHPNDDDVHFRLSEEQMFQDIFRYIEFLFRMIKPRQTFFMAIDGVAPRAKMNQQRGRRFRSAKEAEVKENEARARGEVLPSEARFDSNCITPGTEFMDRLQQQLKYFVAMKISTDDMWKNVNVYLSGHETPGEGEHKIMDFIREQKASPNYNPNTRHCLYGLDADLIMLGLCSHEPHFSLLREEVKFLKTKSVQKVTSRSVNPDVITFHLLHLSLLRDYLDHEFSELRRTISFEYNLENIIDDWILMGFLVGNDFIPHIPHFHINKNSLTNLYRVYMDVLPSLGGYMNEGGVLNLKRFEKFLEKAGEIDVENFTEVYADLKYFGAKSEGNENGQEARELVNFYKEGEADNLEDLINRSNGLFASLEIEAKAEKEQIKQEAANNGQLSEDSEPESEPEDSFDEEFRLHKKHYYETKLCYPKVNRAVMKEQALCYIRAIQWNLHYYYHGCVSWSWFYPHHYAPYISDVKNFSNESFEFDKGIPFRPFEQLLAVLPAASKTLLPKSYQFLVTSANSPLIHYYPENFDLDMNEKQQAWEAVVKIPFIEEGELLSAAKEGSFLFSAREKARNTHGPHLLFTFSEELQEPYPSSLPGVLPDIVSNHAKIEHVDVDHFRINPDLVKQGLCNGVRLDVHFPGFPTLKFIDHTAKLKKDKIRVFEMASNGDNMILEITPPEPVDVDKFAADFLGKSVYVNWPHLIEAQVFKICDLEYRYNLTKNGALEETKMNEQELAEVTAAMTNAGRTFKERSGIYVGPTQALLYVYPITGRKYIPGIGGSLTLEKQWSIVPMMCPLQTAVHNIAVYDPGYQLFQTVADIYPVGAKCFVLVQPYYGQQAEVIENTSKDGTIKVKIFRSAEPDLTDVVEHMSDIMNDEYLPNYVMAQRLGVSGQVMGRVTGMIFVRHGRGKQNIGLGLRYQSRGEEVPGYSKKRDNQWYFSRKVYDTLQEYMEKFPSVFKSLSSAPDQDNFEPKDLFNGKDPAEELKKCSDWLRGLASYRATTQKFEAEVLDECVVHSVEMVLNTHLALKVDADPVQLALKPHLLFRPLHYLGYSLPDPKAQYRLFDRVVNVRVGTSVPLGAKGIIIGKFVDPVREVNTIYDVVFDEPFPGGVALRCSPGRGYKMSPASLIVLGSAKQVAPRADNSANKQRPRNSAFARQGPAGNGHFQSQSPQTNGSQKRANQPHQQQQQQFTIQQRPAQSQPRPQPPLAQVQPMPPQNTQQYSFSKALFPTQVLSRNPGRQQSSTPQKSKSNPPAQQQQQAPREPQNRVAETEPGKAPPSKTAPKNRRQPKPKVEAVKVEEKLSAPPAQTVQPLLQPRPKSEKSRMAVFFGAEQ